MKYIPYLALVIFRITVADFASDLERLITVHNCEPDCTFNNSEITSKTTQFFPQDCTSVCGILTFNENTDLSEDQLRKVFENISTIYGGIRMENTSFQGLSIFGKHPKTHYFDFFCKTYGLSVINNTQLTNINFLKGFDLATDLVTKECPMQFENNPKLDVSFLCDDQEYKELFELKIKGNLKDCGCRGDSISSINVESFKNCSLLYGGIHLSNITNTTSSALSNIKYVEGDIEIQNTRFKNLSFLTKLDTIEVKNGLMNEKVALNIHDNYEMTRLGIPRLKSFYVVSLGPFILNFENLHPDFCLTVFEIAFFLKNLISFKNIHAKLCPGIDNSIIDGFPICQFTTMKTLKERCIFIYGNIKVGPGDEEYMYKLQYMEYLFGTLMIEHTELKDLRELPKLSYIASLDEEYVIEIISNKNLTDAELPMLTNIITKGSRTVVIHVNPVLISEDCMIFPITYQTNVAFIGNNCVYVIMTGIALCDLYTMFTIIYHFVDEYVSLYRGVDCYIPPGYIKTVCNYLISSLLDVLRRLSTWLALLMAVVRLLIIKNHMNPKCLALSTPSFAISNIVILFFLSFIISFLNWGQYSIIDDGPRKIRFCEFLPKNYTVPHTYSYARSEFVDDFRPLAIKYGLLSDGISKVIPAIALPFLSFFLIRCIKKASNSRKILLKLSTEDSREHLEQILINLVVLNAIVHCIICFTVSTQYRSVAETMFLCKKSKRNKIGMDPNRDEVFSTTRRITSSNAVVE